MRPRVRAALLVLALSAGLPSARLRAGDAPGDVAALLRNARSARGRGEHDAARRLAEGAVEAATAPESRREALMLLATIELTGQRFHAARRRILELREVQERLGDRHGVAASDVQLASVDASLGRLTSSLARIQDAVAWFDVHGAPWERRGAHLNAAKIWLGVHDTVRGREHLEKARAAGTGLGLNETALWLIEGGAALREGRPDEAERAFRAAVPWLDGAPPAQRVTAHLGLAVALALARRHDEARVELDRARAALGGRDASRAGAPIDVTACFVHLVRGDAAAAVEAGRRARAATEGLQGSWDAILEERLARAFLLLGDAGAALDAAERAVEAVLRDSGALPDVIGARFRAEQGDAFAWGVEAAARTGEVERLFRIAEKARAAALRARLSAEALVDRTLEPALRDERLRLEEEEAGAVGTYRALLEGGDAAAVGRAHEQVVAVRDRADRLRERIRTRQALPGHLLAPVVAGLDEVRADLRADEALVVYAAGAQRLHSVVVTSGGAKHVALAPVREIDAIVARAVLEDRSAPADAAVAALRGALADPLGIPPSVRRVRIVPVGTVGGVAFAALWPDREIVRLPSVTVGRLLAARPSRGAGRIVAAVGPPWGGGPPLDGAGAEARAAGAKTFLGDDATEGALRDAVAGGPWRAVHLACHALIDPAVPARSALVFRPSPGADGLWTLSEVLGATVRAELVALAACSTGTGRRYGAEGDVGFAHAFFVAGARLVLASLWDVDDRATSELMKRFYAEWRPGVDASAALQRAQASLRADPRWAHPAHWAAWQVWGGP